MRASIAGAALLIMMAMTGAPARAVPAGEEGAPAPGDHDLSLAFVGDIMGHEMNYRMADFHDIYRGIQDEIHSADLAFANLEFPLDPFRPSEGYPYFNGTPAYLAAAVDAGFNLFSIANNHAFDEGVEGIFQTARALERQRAAGRVLAYSGTRGNPWRPFEPEAVTVKGVRIGFVAVAQFLNESDGGRYVHVVDFADPAPARAFVSWVHAIAPLYDLFIVSYHGDREYVQVPSPAKRAFFLSLLDAGAQIVVGHHPHVVQGYEVVQTHGARRVAMFSMGNFISGMTGMLSPGQLRGALAATGESYVLRVRVHCGPDGCSVADADPLPIANYLDDKAQVVVGRLSDLADGTVKVSPEWRSYYAQRLALMREFLGIR